MTTQSAEITHTNKLAIHGAILQALAIHQLLNFNGTDRQLDTNTFLQVLDQAMDLIDKTENAFGFDDEAPYQKQLKQVVRLLNSEPTEVEIVNVLGTRPSALYSVPTAIYCFLRGLNDISGIETSNPFRRSIEYAITLGGDTDTIASMAGSLCGAYFGETIIPENLLKHCEGYDEIGTLANQLYDASNAA